MRTREVLVVGAVLGAAAAWFWGRSLADYVGETTRGVRAKAAEGVRAVDEQTGKVLDFTKDHVSEALRAGQEAIRPA